jgi:very-short-patch-repair endonuclease
MANRRETELILREFGAAQQGIVTRQQLLARGLTASAIDRLVRIGRLRVKHRGVYQIGPAPLPRAAERAAALAAGGEARISHGSAARHNGLLRPDHYANGVEMTMPRGSSRKLKGVRIHRVRDLRDDEVTQVDGIPITTPARTLLDLAEVAPSRDVEQAYAAALRMKLVTPDAMREMVSRHPAHRGAPLWRQLLAQHDAPAFTRSEAEEKLLELTRSARLPRPELNVVVLGYEVDFLWRKERVVVEVDGYAFHATPRAFVTDRRRDAELTAAGYRVLRFTWDDLDGDRLPVIARLAQALVR